ncbi:MAG: hypothetical protein AAGA54_21445 [Myxococcota bacterium]
MGDAEDDRSEGQTSIGRRTVVAGLCVAGVAVGAGMLSPSESGPAALSLGPIAPGATLQGASAVKVVAVHPVTFGALPVILETSTGTRFQVDVLARDPEGPAGVADTDHFSVYVSNQGSGASPTDEGQGLGAMALASALSTFEQSGEPLPSLMTMRERAEQHPRGSFGVPLS